MLIINHPRTQAVTASFVYDGDGRRVKQTINGVTTYFVGAHYEVTAGVATKYYYAGGQRIAMRSGGTLYFMVSTGSTQRLGDHLGSTSLTTSANGTVISELRYKAWGETRYASGTTPTKYQYTGQMSYETDFGLYFYNARWYDSALGRFIQADSIVPTVVQGVQAYDRYAYVSNNPVRYTDSTGHRIDDGCSGDSGGCNLTSLQKAIDAQKLAELKYDPTGQKQKKNREVVDEISPDGWKSSITVSAGWGSNLNANGKKVPTVLYGGIKPCHR